MGPTPSPSSTPASFSVSPSFGASASPTMSSTPLPVGAIKELMVLDCNGGLHLFPGTPMEVNVNLRGARHLVNYAADEIRNSAQCVANSRGW